MKFGRGIVIAAASVYLIVLGCVVLPGMGPGSKLAAETAVDNMPAPAPAPALKGLPYRGAAIQIERVDWIDKYEKCIDEVAADGFDTVSLVVSARQENGTSSRIYLDMRMTPTPPQLSELIQHAKSKNLRVILMPIVLLDNPRGNEWRGTLKPESWDEWFDSYRDMITQFAWIAQQNKVDVLSVGSELVSSENHLSQWTRTINAVRKIYHGRLTYSSNWDHYTSVPFWDQLDLIGLNSYWSLDEVPPGSHNHMKSKVTLAEIKANWKFIQHDLLDFQKAEGKPILFLEIGWCSLANAADEPWDYTRTNLAQDNDLQKRLFEGFFESWYNNPALGGFMVWEWYPGRGGKATADENGQRLSEDDLDKQLKGYTPKNKPAEEVIKRWLAKPWGTAAVSAAAGAGGG